MLASAAERLPAAWYRDAAAAKRLVGALDVAPVPDGNAASTFLTFDGTEASVDARAHRTCPTRREWRATNHQGT